MKYSNSVIIDLPKEEVVKRFDDPENMKFWQKGLLHFELISGSPGSEGAQTRLEYQMGKRSFEMIETIIANRLPDEIHSTYETTGVFNTQKNYFKENGNQTKWISESTLGFTGFMKVMAFFMGSGSFKKQSRAFMEDFKSFAEGSPKYGKS